MAGCDSGRPPSSCTTPLIDGAAEESERSIWASSDSSTCFQRPVGVSPDGRKFMKLTVNCPGGTPPSSASPFQTSVVCADTGTSNDPNTRCVNITLAPRDGSILGYELCRCNAGTGLRSF